MLDPLFCLASRKSLGLVLGLASMDDTIKSSRSMKRKTPTRSSSSKKPKTKASPASEKPKEKPTGKTPRKGSVSDDKWKEGREKSERELPEQRPASIFYCSSCTKKQWQYRTQNGKATQFETIEAAYDASIKNDKGTDDNKEEGKGYEGGLSNEMWQQHKEKSSLDLPEKRPKGLHYVKRNKKWRVTLEDSVTLYYSLDAAYNAIQQGTSTSPDII